MRIPAEAGRVVIRPRALLTMRGETPARGKDLFKPLEALDNAQVICEGGIITAIEQGRVSPGFPVLEVDGILAPPFCNAHLHLQLSWLKDQLVWGQGFTAWLKSMVPFLLERKTVFAEDQQDAVHNAVTAMAEAGAGFIGDIGGSLPGTLGTIVCETLNAGLQATFFCEWFGFNDYEAGIWPPAVHDEDIACHRLVPSGHALYSTSPEKLRRVYAGCRKLGMPFCMHLAESPEETELLTSGSGSLAEYYRDMVLPPDWQPPVMRPLAYAASLGLVGPGSLFVHCVQLDEREIATLGESGASVCLCPRSNYNLGVGEASFARLAASGALLSLGTDGLCSNTDLDPVNDAVFLRQTQDVPKEALIRMLTVNGVASLGMSAAKAWLEPGSPALFGVLPGDMEIQA